MLPSKEIADFARVGTSVHCLPGMFHIRQQCGVGTAVPCLLRMFASEQAMDKSAVCGNTGFAC